MSKKERDEEFEWDDEKASLNRKKHKVAFVEAAEVFSDAPRIFDDLLHSAEEDRYVAIGFSNRGRLITVSHVYREGRVRIFSARLATKAENDAYGKGHA